MRYASNFENYYCPLTFSRKSLPKPAQRNKKNDEIQAFAKQNLKICPGDSLVFWLGSYVGIG